MKTYRKIYCIWWVKDLKEQIARLMDKVDEKINQMKEIAPPTKEKLQQIQKQLEQFNLEVQIEE